MVGKITATAFVAFCALALASTANATNANSTTQVVIPPIVTLPKTIVNLPVTITTSLADSNECPKSGDPTFLNLCRNVEDPDDKCSEHGRGDDGDRHDGGPTMTGTDMTGTDMTGDHCPVSP
jgi:hypothetical protein